MSSFTKPLTVTKISGRKWMIARAFKYYIYANLEGDCVDIPEGYITDFASVPRVFWHIVPPDGQYTQAAVVHDYLYDNEIYSKEKADHIFYQAMGVLGVPDWKRNVMYWAVKHFGKPSWMK